MPGTQTSEACHADYSVAGMSVYFSFVCHIFDMCRWVSHYTPAYNLKKKKQTTNNCRYCHYHHPYICVGARNKYKNNVLKTRHLLVMQLKKSPRTEYGSASVTQIRNTLFSSCTTVAGQFNDSTFITDI